MANGTLDTGTLTALPAQPHLRLTAAAAAAWVWLVATIWTTYGWVLTATDAYRDYAAQERLFRQRYTTTYLPGRPSKVWQGRRWYLKAGYAAAAVPGTSNHGLGITVDVANLGGFNGTRYRQFASIAEPAGWSNAEGRSINEAWHWNYRGGGSAVSNPITSPGAVAAAPDVATPDPISRLVQEDDMVRIRTLKGAIYLVNLDPSKPVFRVLDPTENSLWERLSVPIVWDRMSEFERDQVRQLVRDTTTFGITA